MFLLLLPDVILHPPPTQLWPVYVADSSQHQQSGNILN
jgi:hypothetical protein